MKQKEIIQLAVAAVVLGVCGILIFSLLNPSKSAKGKGVSVEIIKPIPSSFDSTAISKITDPSSAHDFYTKPDLHNGVGNNQPFGSGQ